MYDEINFDSQSEMNYYKYLKGREDVTHIECHPSFTPLYRHLRLRAA
ncbi:hypothetical protein [Bacillus thuringiensis]